MNKSEISNSIVNSNRIIYTASPLAKKNMLYLQETGWTQSLSPHESKRSYLSSYLFFVVTSGSGTIQYDQSEYTLRSGDCAFLDCHKTYSHRTSEDLWNFMWVHFDGKCMTELYDHFFPRHEILLFHSENLQKYKQLVQNIYDVAASDSVMKDLSLFQNLTTLLNEIVTEKRISENETFDSSNLQKLLPIKIYIDEHYKEPLTLDELSGIFFMNKFYLERLFKAEFGTPIKSYIIQKRITHAKHLLRFSDISIEDVSIASGFSDGNYFTRVFKKAEGITPYKFRKSWSE